MGPPVKVIQNGATKGTPGNTNQDARQAQLEAPGTIRTPGGVWTPGGHETVCGRGRYYTADPYLSERRGKALPLGGYEWGWVGCFGLTALILLGYPN